jgi:ribosomal protein L37AE/L43A
MKPVTDISSVELQEINCPACKQKFKVAVVKENMFCSRICKSFITGESEYLKQVLIGKVRHIKPEKIK